MLLKRWVVTCMILGCPRAVWEGSMIFGLFTSCRMGWMPCSCGLGRLGRIGPWFRRLLFLGSGWVFGSLLAAFMAMLGLNFISFCRICPSFTMRLDCFRLLATFITFITPFIPLVFSRILLSPLSHKSRLFLP